MQNQSDHSTTVEAWKVWRKTCAVGLCPPSAADLLRGFGSQRFFHYLNHYGSRTGRRAPIRQVPETQNAWHLLETHARVGATREGKRYKDWLFMRAEIESVEWIRAVEAGATLLIRDVVREYLRREHAPAFMESLQRPLGSGKCPAYTLEELLPDTVEPLGAVEEREWEDFGRRLAEPFFSTMSSRERIALWARDRQLALTDPALCQWAGCRKSVLHQTYGECIQRLCAAVKEAYPSETPAIWVQLARKTLDQLNRIIFLNISSEKGAARFFKKKGIKYKTRSTEDDMARS